MTSLGLLVAAVIVNDVPEDHAEVVLPSMARADPDPGSVVCVSTVRHGEVHPVIGAFWFSK